MARTLRAATRLLAAAAALLLLAATARAEAGHYGECRAPQPVMPQLHRGRADPTLRAQLANSTPAPCHTLSSNGPPPPDHPRPRAAAGRCPRLRQLRARGRGRRQQLHAGL
jgi:hypothetical protein